WQLFANSRKEYKASAKTRAFEVFRTQTMVAPQVISLSKTDVEVLGDAQIKSATNNSAGAIVRAGIPRRQPVPSEQTVNEWLKMLGRKTDGGTHHGLVGIVCVTKMTATIYR